MPNPTYQKRLIDLKQEKEGVDYKVLEAIFKLMEQKPRTTILFLRDILVDYCHNALENGTEQAFDVKKLEDWAFKLQNWISEQTPKWNTTTTQQEQAEQQWMKLMDTTVEGYGIGEKPFTVREFKKWITESEDASSKVITESADASNLYAVVTYFICQYYWLDREGEKAKQKNPRERWNTAQRIDFIANFTEQLPINTNKPCTLYQLECATGDFLVDIFLKNEQASNLHFVGQTHRKDFYILCHLNLILANCRNFDIQLANPYPFLPTYQGKADVIIAPQIPILHPAYWTWDLIAEVLENDRWQYFDEAVWIDKLIDFGHAKTRYLLALPNNLLKHAGSSQILRTAIDQGWVESLCPTKHIETVLYPNNLFADDKNKPDIALLAQEMRKLPNGDAFFENKYQPTGEEELAEYHQSLIDALNTDELGSSGLWYLSEVKKKYESKSCIFVGDNPMYIALDSISFGIEYGQNTIATTLLLLNKDKHSKTFSIVQQEEKRLWDMSDAETDKHSKTFSIVRQEEKIKVELKKYTLHVPLYIYNYKKNNLSSIFLGENDKEYTLREVIDCKVLSIDDYEKEFNKIMFYKSAEWSEREGGTKRIVFRSGRTDTKMYEYIADITVSINAINKDNAEGMPKDAIILAKENETELPFPDDKIVHYKEDLKFRFDETTNLQPSLYPPNRQNFVLANKRWKRLGMEWKRSPDSFERFLYSNNFFFISKSAVVVSLTDAPYSMCLPANTKVDVPNRALIFILKSGFDTEFITLLFRQLDWVAEQFDACALEYGEGKGTKYITVNDLLDFKLPIPPLAEQQKIVLEYKARQVDQLILDIKLKEAYEQTRAIEYEVIASISHSLKNKLGIINNDLETLINILETKEAQQILNLQEPIRPYFDTEDRATTHIDTAAQIIDRLRKGFAEASDIFKTAEKMQYRKLNFQTVNLNEYFEQVKYKFAVPNQNIEVKGNIPNLVLKIDTDAMNEVIENLIINARKHGFINKEQLYHLVFELSQVNRNGIEYAQITYQNDGKAMPKDFSFADFIRFSEKAGKTQGDGIGGYTINKIVQLHGGIFEEAKPSIPSFNVAFNILLPIQSSSK